MHHSHQLTAAIEADTEVDMLSAVSAMLRELTAGSRIGTSDGKRKIAYTYHVDPPQVAVPVVSFNEPFGPSGFGGEPETLAERHALESAESRSVIDSEVA